MMITVVSCHSISLLNAWECFRVHIEGHQEKKLVQWANFLVGI